MPLPATTYRADRCYVVSVSYITMNSPLNELTYHGADREKPSRLTIPFSRSS